MSDAANEATMTIDQLFEIYSRKRLKSGSKNTTRLYKFSIKNFGISIGVANPTLADFTDDNLERHMWRIISEGLSPATANKDCSQLSAMWRFANLNRMVETWPNVRLLPLPERVPLAWTASEVKRLLASIEHEDGEICRIPARLWWSALIHMLLDTGERIGAARGVKRTGLQGNYLIFPAEIRKGRKREKMYKLSEETLDKIRLMWTYSTHDKLFPWDRSETYIYYRYKKILRRAGLDDSARSMMHRLRRTVASAVANQGGDPTAALDHACPKTTKAYLDPRIVDDKSTVDLVRQWLDGEEKKPRDYRK